VILSTQLEILIALIGLLAAVVLATLAARGERSVIPASRRAANRPDPDACQEHRDTEPSVLTLSHPGHDLIDSRV
jgi:hypothetical protein